MHVIRIPTHASAAVLPRPIIRVTASLFFPLYPLLSPASHSRPFLRRFTYARSTTSSFSNLLPYTMTIQLEPTQTRSLVRRNRGARNSRNYKPRAKYRVHQTIRTIIIVWRGLPSEFWNNFFLPLKIENGNYTRGTNSQERKLYGIRMH